MNITIHKHTDSCLKMFILMQFTLKIKYSYFICCNASVKKILEMHDSKIILLKKKITTCPLEELDWIRSKTVRISFGKTLQTKKKKKNKLG